MHRESFLEGNSKSKAQKKSKHLLATEPLPACLELKGEPIEVQEFLQSVVREFQWGVGENHASEDTWSFVRYLNDCEGYVACRSAHTYKATGKRAESFPASRQPGGALNSKGILEQERIGALQTCFKHAA